MSAVTLGGRGGRGRVQCKQTADREEQWRIVLASCFKLIKKHIKNALILYLIVVADSQLYWQCSVLEILFL